MKWVLKNHKEYKREIMFKTTEIQMKKRKIMNFNEVGMHSALLTL
ncbi:hypothetical protein [Providencia rustigianii]|uniref:Uncharacterized protein n=1 Tax=Providencia rustigianii DSM 4541 TaxID=500637 RepID=D1P2Y2_9GAMM|nr:hypothetical protein [Providencia rustigianii]EFB72487.1 hypothetical protein PROVRUST_06563 [Providencia rustigianii DSM 4541]